jgi:hypothetical protein
MGGLPRQELIQEGPHSVWQTVFESSGLHFEAPASCLNLNVCLYVDEGYRVAAAYDVGLLDFDFFLLLTFLATILAMVRT